MIQTTLFVLHDYAGVTEEQFKESWTRPGTAGLGAGATVVVAKARM